MCTHHHKKTYINGLSETCIITDYAKDHQLTIPIDDKGKCIFHSTDIAWKRANNCGEKFWELLQTMAQDETITDIDCREFWLTGLEYGEIHGYEEGKVPLKGENIIVLAKAHLKKSLRMQGAKFYDDVLIQDIICEEAADFDEAVFKGVVTIERCNFRDMVSFINDCRFEHNLVMSDCFFEENFDFHNVVAMHQIMMSTITFGGPVSFVGFSQIAEDLICSFTEIYFNDYTSFNDAGFNGSVAFDNCHFLGETHFENTAFRKRFQVIEPRIGDKMFFRATKPGVKLFDTAVDFGVTKDSFEGMGQLIFEQVNLFNFDAIFKEQIKALELAHKIELRAGCLLYRTAVERVFPYTRFNKIMLEDISRALANYFETLHQRALQVDISRDLKKEEIRVLFHTEENMSIVELEQLIYQTKENVLLLLEKPAIQLAKATDKAINLDHLLKFQNLFERSIIARSNGLLTDEMLESLLTTDGKNIHPKLKELFGVTINIYAKNIVKNNRIKAGGNIHIGDA